MLKSDLLKAFARPKVVKVPFSKAVTQIHQSPKLLGFNKKSGTQFEPSPAKKYGPNSALGLLNTHLRFRGFVSTREVSPRTWFSASLSNHPCPGASRKCTRSIYILLDATPRFPSGYRADLSQKHLMKEICWCWGASDILTPNLRRGKAPFTFRLLDGGKKNKKKERKRRKEIKINNKGAETSRSSRVRSRCWEKTPWIRGAVRSAQHQMALPPRERLCSAAPELSPASPPGPSSPSHGDPAVYKRQGGRFTHAAPWQP